MLKITLREIAVNNNSFKKVDVLEDQSVKPTYLLDLR